MAPYLRPYSLLIQPIVSSSPRRILSHLVYFYKNSLLPPINQTLSSITPPPNCASIQLLLPLPASKQAANQSPTIPAFNNDQPTSIPGPQLINLYPSLCPTFLPIHRLQHNTLFHPLILVSRRPRKSFPPCCEVVALASLACSFSYSAREYFTYLLVQWASRV